MRVADEHLEIPAIVDFFTIFFAKPLNTRRGCADELQAAWSSQIRW
jgi:hypothetical protein